MRMLRDSILLPVRRLGDSRGAALLYVIGALLVLGALGAGIAVMSPSSTQSKLEQEAGMRAYYNAQSGLQFIYSRAASSSANKMTGTDFMNLIGNDTSKTYYLPDGGQFTYKTVFSTANSTSANYSITYLAGEVTGASSNARYTYIIFGGDKGTSSIKNYKPSSGGGSGDDTDPYKDVHIFSSKLSIGNNAFFDGSVMGKDIVVSDSSYIGGDVISSSDIDIVSHTTINGIVCANGDITTSSNSTFNGDIKSQGNISIGSSLTIVKNSIYAIGSVTIGSSVTVDGNINAGGNIQLVSPSYVYGSVYTNGNLNLGNNSTVGQSLSQSNAYVKNKTGLESASYIYGNLYSGSDISVGWGSQVSGTTCTGGAVTGDKRYINECSSYKSADLLPPTLPGECKILTAPQHASASNFPSRGTDISIQNNILSLSPGTYGNISIGWLGTLKLVSGVYHFVSLDMTGNQTKLYLDSSNGDVTIFVTKYVKLGNLFKVIMYDGSNEHTYSSIDMSSSEKLIAEKSYLETMGTITFGNENSWIGTLYAEGDINFGNKTRLLGAAVSAKGTVGPTNNVESYYVESDYAKTWVPSE